MANLPVLTLLALAFGGGCGGSNSSGTVATPTPQSRAYDAAIISVRQTDGVPAGTIYASPFISPNGTVAGVYQEGGTGHYFLFVWRNGQVQMTGVPTDLFGIRSMFVAGLNDSGQVLVNAFSDTGSTPYLWQAGTFTRVDGGIGAVENTASGISANGNIVGFYRTAPAPSLPGQYFPYRWRAGVLTPLSLPGGRAFGAGILVCSNGFIVGTAKEILETPDIAPSYRLVVWDINGNRVSDGNTLPEMTTNYTLNGVSDSGQILVQDSNVVVRHGVAVPALLNINTGGVTAINELATGTYVTPGGTILGYTDSANSSAAIVSGGVVTNLPKTLPDSHLAEIEMRAVNDAGQLVCFARDTNNGLVSLYLLTPH